jgi:spectinomycin phosphotransferase
VPVHERLAELSDADIASVLDQCWGLDVLDVRYAPVGFGGYHWIAFDAAGPRWFVTASRVPGPADLADLRATMRAALGLARAGLEFVVGPVAAADGEVVVGIRPDLALSVFPFADGSPGRWGDAISGQDRVILMDILAALHTTTGEMPVRDVPASDLPVRELSPRSRAFLEAALAELDRPWRGGPYSEPARTLVADHAAGLAAALAAFDDLAAQVRASGESPVLTHGEIHPGNLIRRGTGYLLVDWDTAGLAPPERDLWWIVSDSGAEAAQYAERTGREVSQAAIALYRLRWDLDDIGLFLAGFRAPHERDKDTEHGLAGLAAAIRRLSSPEKFS